MVTAVDQAQRKALHAWARLPWGPRALLRHGVEAAKLWSSENGSELGAAIAFYSMFALAPLLVIAISVAGLVFGPDAARGEIVQQIGGLIGTDAARSIEAMIKSAWRSQEGGVAAVLGVITLLIGASGVFAEMRNALNRIGHVAPQRGALGAFVRARLVAFALVLGFGFLIIASLLLSAALSAFTGFMANMLPILAGVLHLTEFVVTMLVLTVAFAAFLRWLPDRAPGWKPVWIGALVSALLFSIGKQLIGIYLGRASVTNSFGAAGSLVVVLMWIYYSSQILLFGAAMTWSFEGVRAEHQQPHPKSPHGPKKKRGHQA